MLRSQSPNEVDEVSDDKCLQHDHHAASFQEFTFRNLLKKLNSTKRTSGPGRFFADPLGNDTQNTTKKGEGSEHVQRRAQHLNLDSTVVVSHV